ncbi:MAG: hypothetical protein GXO76_08680 [Calditrichaeota bacterium]|nr:hypothetical protein [Calditrichota bacterium]
MLFLLTEIGACLIFIAVLAFGLGWFLRGQLAKNEIHRLEKLWKINLLAKDLALEKKQSHINKENKK